MRTAAVATLRLVPRAALALPPRARRILLAALAAVAVLVLSYFLWLRDAPFVAVNHVRISGLTTKDAHNIRQALIASAEDMTTLHVREDKLELAVSGYPVVASVRATPDFPHGLRIQVVEHRPIAVLVIRGGSSIEVAADGTVLRGLPLDRSLPVLPTASPPRGSRLTRGHAGRTIRSVAAAPAALRRRIQRVDEEAGRGLVVQLRRGPYIVLGTAARLEAKWAAVARVLADPRARGASYVNVQLPERPVAGGLGAQTIAPSAPAGTVQPKPDKLAPGATTTTPGASAPPTTNPQP